MIWGTLYFGAQTMMGAFTHTKQRTFNPRPVHFAAGFYCIIWQNPPASGCWIGTALLTCVKVPQWFSKFFFH